MKRIGFIFIGFLALVAGQAVTEESYPESYNEYADYTDPSDTSLATTQTPTKPVTILTTILTTTTSTTSAPIRIAVPPPSNGSVINNLKTQQQSSTQRIPGFPVNGQAPRFTQTTSFPQRISQNNNQQPKNQLPQTVFNSFRTGGLKQILAQKVSPRNAQEIKRQQEKVRKIANRRLNNLKKKIQKQNQQQRGPSNSKAKVQSSSSSKKIMNHF